MSLVFRINKKRLDLGGRNGMKQMYELKNLVTVSEFWISNFLKHLTMSLTSIHQL